MRCPVWDNGILRDATAEELANWESMAEQTPAPVPTAEERLDALEAAIMRGVELGYER